MAEEQVQVMIVGAGPSGLAMAAYLHHFSIPYTILEREDCFASIWQKYSYDRVHLHLPKHFCHLPLMPIPPSYPKYVPKKDFVQYLTEYVERFEIKPLYQRCVEKAWYDEVVGKWKVITRKVDDNGSSGQKEYYSCRFLVVATGESCDPAIPSTIEGSESFKGEVLHSTQYKNGKEFKDKRVLVVGSGNSGMEIAYDLANHDANTSIVIRSPTHIVSRPIMHLGMVMLNYISRSWADSTVTLISNFMYGDLKSYGIKRPDEGPYAMMAKYGKYPVVDVGTIQKIKASEIQVLPGIKLMQTNSVVFENGKEYPFDAVIFATGFKRSTKQWLKGDDSLLNDDGMCRRSFPNHWKGKNGLYCIGLWRRGFKGAAMDAQNIAYHIKALL